MRSFEPTSMPGFSLRYEVWIRACLRRAGFLNLRCSRASSSFQSGKFAPLVTRGNLTARGPETRTTARGGRSVLQSSGAVGLWPGPECTHIPARIALPSLQSVAATGVPSPTYPPFRLNPPAARRADHRYQSVGLSSGTAAYTAGVTRIPPADALRARFRAALSPTVDEAIQRVIDSARGTDLYAVGGVVRDLLLGVPALDIDLAVEGDAVDPARRAFPDAKITVHARFGTASLVVNDTRIDLASTRSETYARPGALPRVTPAAIDDDLRRRDFSMNAMALRLTGAAVLADPCDGADDVAARVVRVLHDGSFADDATRIYRALRYAARLGFSLETHTAALLDDGVAHIAAVGGERLRREIELLLTEPTGGIALEACHAARALRAIHRALHWDARNTEALASDQTAPPEPYGFALLAGRASRDDAAAICERLKLKRDEAAAVQGIAAMHGLEKMLRRPHAKPSGVVVLLDRFPAAAVAAFASTASDAIARQMALRYLGEWQHVKPILSGRDLQGIGVPAGPNVHKGLQLIRAARLDGWVTDRDDERALIMRFAKSIRESGAAISSVELHLNGN